MRQERLVSAFGTENGLFPRTGTVLCAVSGGADSVCMLRILLAVGKEKGFSVAAAHYNHRLRGAESDGDEAFVRALCRQWEVPLSVGAGDVAREAAKTGCGIEEAARTMRYAFLERAAEETHADCIATAHTADDNGETILMNLGRGTGLSGLTGIPVRRGNIVRPMLCLTRQDVLSYLSDMGISHREDSTNALDDCLRNRIRHTVMEPLKAIFPGFSASCAQTSGLLREDEGALSAMAEAFLAECGGVISASRVAGLPAAVGSRVVRRLIGGGEAVHVRAVLALCRSADPSGQVSVPGCTVRREYDVLTVDGLPPETFPEIALTGEEGEAELPECGLTVRWHRGNGEIHKSFTTLFFNLRAVCGTMVLRSRREGDRLVPSGRGVEKTVKKLMLEAKIPACRRGIVPVVCDDKGILGVYGLCMAERGRCRPGEPAIIIEFEGRKQSHGNGKGH